MKISIQSAPIPTTRKILSHSRFAQSQNGVVLIIALIILAVISLLAVTSIRNASSTISVSSNVRTTELATQAAAIALQHCERSVWKVLNVEAGVADSYVTTFTRDNILSQDSTNWQNRATWDTNPDYVFQLPLYMIKQADMVITYKRNPECMVESMVVAKAVPGSTTREFAVKPNSLFRIIARGFGPEVENVTGRPVGSEVWLQSQIKFRYN